MKKTEVTPLERKIYEKYLLKIIRNHLTKWNQSEMPNILKAMSKDIVREVSSHIKDNK